MLWMFVTVYCCLHMDVMYWGNKRGMNISHVHVLWLYINTSHNIKEDVMYGFLFLKDTA